MQQQALIAHRPRQIVRGDAHQRLQRRNAREVVGAEVTLFGGPDGPSAEDWGAACGTIGYEIVTRIGSRVPRVYA